jgi:hypothetical protein
MKKLLIFAGVGEGTMGLALLIVRSLDLLLARPTAGRDVDL